MAKSNGVLESRKPEENLDLTLAQRMDVMKMSGWEQIIPTTLRHVRLRTVEPADLLRSGECPDILTPLMLRSIYQDLTDPEIRELLDKPPTQVEEAIKYSDMIDLVVAKGIADDTAMSALSLGEKKWIFRLLLSPAEMMVLFRHNTAQAVVESVAEGEPVSQTAE